MSSDATDNTMRAELLPCPFCGREVSYSVRAGSVSEDVGFLCFIACCCDGYAACAHKMGRGDAPAAAMSDAAVAWNRRADTARQVAEDVAAEREACKEACLSLQDMSQIADLEAWIEELKKTDDEARILIACRQLSAISLYNAAFKKAAAAISARSTPATGEKP